MRVRDWSKRKALETIGTISMLLAFAFITFFLWIYPEVNQIMKFADISITYHNSIWVAFVLLPLSFLALFTLFSGKIDVEGRACRLRGKWFSICEMLRFRTFFILLLIASVALFVNNLLKQNYSWAGIVNDGGTYQAMAASFWRHYEFLVPAYTNMPAIERSTEIVYSRHMSPLYPLYLSAFIFMGASEAAFKVAYFVIFILSIVIVYLTTRNLFGSREALATSAIMASIQPIADYIAMGYSEAMVLIFYTLVVWAIIRSIETERYIIYAGLFAGLGYLTRSSIGYFFLLAGLAGFVWRFYYMRWRVLRNRNYLMAIIVFFSFVGAWAARNIVRFWDGTFIGLFSAWETDMYIEYCFKQTLDHFSFYLIALLMKGVFFAVMIFGYAWMIIPQLRESLGQIRNERVSGLWLAFLLPNVISLFIVSAFFVVEAGYPWVTPFWLDNLRYVFFTFVPLFWIAFEAIRQKEVPGNTHG